MVELSRYISETAIVLSAASCLVACGSRQGASSEAGADAPVSVVTPDTEEAEPDPPSPAPAKERPPTIRGTAPPALPRAERENVELVGHLGGKLVDLEVDETTGYAGFLAELAVLDLSNPTRPERVGVLPLETRKLAFHAYRLYVLDGDHDLWVIDVSDPTAPRPHLFVDLPEAESDRDIAVAGDLVFVTVGHEVIAFDTNEPSAIVSVERIELEAPPSLLAIADEVLLAAAGSRLYAIDSSRELQVVGVFDVESEIRSLAASGSQVYVGWESLTVLDVSSPSLIREVARLATEDQSTPIQALVARPGLLFAARWFGPVQIVDIAEASAPRLLSSIEAENPDVVAHAGHYLLVGDWDGLHVHDVDVHLRESPRRAAFHSTLSMGTTMARVGDRLAMVQGEHGPAGMVWGGVALVDLETPASPELVAYHDLGNIGQDIAVDGRTLYVSTGDCRFGAAACWGQVVKLGVRPGPLFVKRGAVDLGVGEGWSGSIIGKGLALDHLRRIVVVGGPYYPSTRDGFVIYAARSPRSFARIGMLEEHRPGAEDESWRGNDVAVRGRYAFVAAHDKGLRVIDIARPARPREVGALELPERQISLDLSGSHLLLGADDGALRVIDPSDPTAPREVGIHTFPDGVFGIARRDDLVFVTGPDMGLRVLDVSTPRPPRVGGHYVTRGEVFSGPGDDRHIYATGVSGGVFVLRYDE